MKILLTVVVCENSADTENALCDGIELLYPDDGEDTKEFLQRAFKIAKGKYSVICDRRFKLADVQSVLNIIDKNTSDMICFQGGAALKTALYRSAVKDSCDAFSCLVLAVLDCKTILKTFDNPFTFHKITARFTEQTAQGVLLSAERFGKVKAKLPKEIYSYAANLLCEKLNFYYLYLMLKIKNGEENYEKLTEFDAKLKAEIVLYLTFEKRFPYGNLNKLRSKNFKINYFTAKKYRKILNLE